MRPLAIALIVSLASLLPAAASAQEPSPPPRVTQVDASRYPEITVYVRVEDARGRPVSGLAAADFALTEGGRPAEITGFAGGAGPVTAALVLDRSLSMAEAGKLRGAQRAALAFVERMRPGDRTALMPFSSAPARSAGFTDDQQALRSAVGRLRPDGGTALYDSIASGVDALRDAPGRRALLALTDGQDCRDDPECPDEYGSAISADEAIAYASEAGQPVYVVGLGERGRDGRAGVDEAVLRRIAEDTGGAYFYAPDAARLAELYARLAAGIQQEYALTYRSPRPFYDGTRRDIAVTVGDAQAARGGYLQQHLINVRSNPVVGFVLLVPLVWALLLPGLRRRPKIADGAPVQRVPAVGATLVEARTFCGACGRPLRPGARFCPACGAAVHGEVWRGEALPKEE